MDSSPKKIQKDTHYNVILMSDGGAAKTYRMRKGTLRFILFFPFVMLIIGGGIIAGGVYFSKHYFDLVAQRGQLDKEINELRLQLERLTNLESLLSTGSGGAPLAKHEEIGVVPPAERMHPDQRPDPEHEIPGETPATGANTTPGTPAPASAATPETVSRANVSLLGRPQTAPGVETVAQSPAAPLPNLDFSAMETLNGDKSPLRVSNFSARPLGQQRVRIRYDLNSSSRGSGRAISGLARHFAVLAEGKRAELPLPDNGEARFSITRLKNMEATARLPQGFDSKDIKQIDVVIITDEQGAFQQRFDVSN